MKRMTATRRVALGLSTLLITLLFSSVALSQQSTSSVRGTVRDPQGNVVAGATATISNPATNFSRAATTNESGQFVFESLQPGLYQLEFEAKGFKKTVLTEVRATRSGGP
jgi:hypothetical protein